MLGSTDGSSDGEARGVSFDARLSTEPGSKRLALTVPGRPESVRVVRAVMRSWAASVGYYLDEIEELCLAIDEAFAGLVAPPPTPDTITIRIQSRADGVDITAVRDKGAEMWPPVSAQSALIRRVLSTLIDEVLFEETPEGPAIHMVKRRVTAGNKSDR